MSHDFEGKQCLEGNPPQSSDEFVRLLAVVAYREEDIVFIGGSYAEGWNNRLSDYDVYVLGADHSNIESNGDLLLPGSGRRVRIKYLLSGSCRVECQYWLTEDVLDIVNALEGHCIQPLDEFWSHLLLFIHRVRIGIPIYNAARFERLRKNIDFELLAEYLWRFHSRVCESYVTDAVAALDAGNSIDAMHMARLAVDHCVDAYLASKHETNPQPKWRYRKLSRIEGSDSVLVQRYLKSLGVPIGSQPLELESHVRDALQFVESLSVCMQFAWPFGDIAVGQDDGPSRPVRQEGVRLQVDNRGKILLTREDGMALRLNETSALTWALMDGHASKDTVIRVYTERFNLGLDDARREVDTILDLFDRERLIRY